MQTRFEVTGIPATEDAAKAFVASLDHQIDELTNNLQLLQGLRRATATTFGIDRREGGGKIQQMHDSSRRAEYEGDGSQPDGRLKVAK